MKSHVETCIAYRAYRQLPDDGVIKNMRRIGKHWLFDVDGETHWARFERGALKVGKCNDLSVL